MSHATRLTLLIAAVILGAGFPAARVHAQTPPVDMVDEEWNLKVPFILRNVSPEIISVSVDCRIIGHPWVQSDVLSSKSVSVLVSDLAKQAAGTIAGTLETRHVFKRLASKTGTNGNYDCTLWGSTLAGPRTMFSSAAGTDSRFRVTGNTTNTQFKW